MFLKLSRKLQIEAFWAKQKIKTTAKEMCVTREGAFAFEYIIVLVLMVTVIFIAWGTLGDLVIEQVDEIAKVMRDHAPGGGRPVLPGSDGKK